MAQFSFSDATTPADLFLAGWLVAACALPNDRITAREPSPAYLQKFSLALMQDDGGIAVSLLRDTISYFVDDEAGRLGLIIYSMREIDKSLRLIHPRLSLLPPKPHTPPIVPTWMLHLEEARRSLGIAFAVHDNLRLVFRGPLGRAPREQDAANGDLLADYFGALSVVPHIADVSGRQIPINQKIIPVCPIKGVTIGTTHGFERILFVPFAVEDGDLVIEEKAHAGATFVDFSLAPSINPSTLLSQVINQAGHIDLVIGTEFVMPESYAQAFAESATNNLVNRPRMIICGSGQTKSQYNGMPWNELRVLNGMGTELWRHRKIWPASISEGAALAYGIACTGSIYEFTAAGDSVVIADVDGLGRCLVLICQDIKEGAAKQLISAFQPDWVFLPILDKGAGEGRWFHQEAFALSACSHARYVISSSLALARKDPTIAITSSPCGLVVGPLQPTFDANGSIIDRGRDLADVFVPGGRSPSYAILDWQTAAWRRTHLGSGD